MEFGETWANGGGQLAIAGHFEQNSMGGRGTLGWNEGDLPLRPVKPQGDHQMLVTHSLRADGFDASEDGTGRGTPLIPIDMRQASRGDKITNNRENGSGGAPGHGVGEEGDPAFTVSERGQAVAGMTVRRLTPTECEKLQGLPPGYTLVPYRGKPAADGPRYRAIGNSMAVPVMRWILTRLVEASA